MGFQQLSIGTDFLRNGGQTFKLDTNQDKNPEYTLNKTESGSSFEIFDFNSDGQKDMELYYDKNGEFIESGFYDKNGKIYQPEKEEVLAYLEQCEALKSEIHTPMFDTPKFEEYKGINDIQEEQITIMQKMRNLLKSLNEQLESTSKKNTNEEDISKAEFKFKSIG